MRMRIRQNEPIGQENFELDSQGRPRLSDQAGNESSITRVFAAKGSYWNTRDSFTDNPLSETMADMIKGRFPKDLFILPVVQQINADLFGALIARADHG